jgi:mannose-6-phosphate isomerase-like protein (cupin superfamily)
MPNPFTANLLTAPQVAGKHPKVTFGHALMGTAADDVNLQYVRIESDFTGGLHYHEHSENVYLVLSGTLTVVVDGTTYELGPNDLVFVPKGSHHSASNYGTDPVECIEIYAPPKSADDSHPV